MAFKLGSKKPNILMQKGWCNPSPNAHKTGGNSMAHFEGDVVKPKKEEVKKSTTPKPAVQKEEAKKSTTPAPAKPAVQPAVKPAKPSSKNQGKDAVDSGGSYLMYDSNSNTFKYSPNSSTIDVTRGGKDLQKISSDLYGGDHLVTKDEDGNVIKTQNKGDFQTYLGADMRNLIKARQGYGTSQRPVNFQRARDAETDIGGFTVSPNSPQYNPDVSFMDNLRQMSFTEPVYDPVDDSSHPGAIRSWNDLNRSEKDRFFNAERQRIDNDFYNTKEMENFRSRYPNVNNRTEYDESRGDWSVDENMTRYRPDGTKAPRS